MSRDKPPTEQELLERELDAAFPNAQSKQIVTHKGQKYKRVFLPISTSDLAKRFTSGGPVGTRSTRSRPMTDPKLEFLTLEQVRELLPKEARPPLRFLREKADQLGIPRRRFNRQRVLTRDEAERLLCAPDSERIGSREWRRSHYSSEQRPRYWLEQKRLREKQAELEKWGLIKTSKRPGTR